MSDIYTASLLGAMFDWQRFMPHGQCYKWEPGVLWSHVLSDLLIATAYFSIPVALAYFMYKRKDLKFRFIFLLFALFITACGITHAMSVVTTWIPAYQIDALLKAATALVSITTAIMLWRIMPHALALPTPQQLESANDDLKREMQTRFEAEEALRKANADLEQRIRERTEALEKVNEMMRQVIESAPTAIIVVDAAGKITLHNPRAEQLFGYSHDELAGLAVEALIPERFRGAHPGLRADFMRAPSTRAMGAGRDLFALDKQGREIPVEIGLNPMTTADGTFVLASVIDITERYRQQQLLNNTLKELARTNNSLDEFVYVVSHDLKEPLRGMSNYASFLLEDYSERLDEDGRRYLNSIQDLAHRLHDLIDKLLSYSRLGHAELDIRPVDLGALVQNVLAALSQMLEQENASVHIDEPLPRAACDQTLVGQVFQNLITNAVKYNDKEDKEIRIGCREDDGETICFVQDNGIGIPDKHRETIFRIFKRLHPATAYGGGTGAGLTIARKVIERHGGRIWAEPAPGEGSTFIFTMPKSQYEPDEHK